MTAQTLTITSDKTSHQFDLSISGVDFNDKSDRILFVIEHKKIKGNIVVECTQKTGQQCTISFDEQLIALLDTNHTFHVDVIVSDYYFRVYTGKLKIVKPKIKITSETIEHESAPIEDRIVEQVLQETPVANQFQSNVAVKQLLETLVSKAITENSKPIVNESLIPINRTISTLKDGGKIDMKVKEILSRVKKPN